MEYADGGAEIIPHSSLSLLSNNPKFSLSTLSSVSGKAFWNMNDFQCQVHRYTVQSYILLQLAK
jgi:hypothetical protein